MLRKDKHPYHVFPLQRGGREGRCIHFLLLGNKSPHLVLTTFSVNQEFRYEFAVFSAGIEVLAGAVVSSKSIHFICRILFFFCSCRIKGPYFCRQLAKGSPSAPAGCSQALATWASPQAVHNIDVWFAARPAREDMLQIWTSLNSVWTTDPL